MQQSTKIKCDNVIISWCYWETCLSHSPIKGNNFQLSVAILVTVDDSSEINLRRMWYWGGKNRSKSREKSKKTLFSVNKI